MVDLLEHLRDLVDMLAIGRRSVAPLVTVHGLEVAIGVGPVAQIDTPFSFKVSADQRQLESDVVATVHPYSVSAGQCSLPNFGQARESVVCPAILGTMEQRTDRLTAAYVDLAVNVARVFGVEAGMRVLQNKAPLPVMQRVLIDVGPRRGAALATPGSSSYSD